MADHRVGFRLEAQDNTAGVDAASARFGRLGSVMDKASAAGGKFAAAGALVTESLKGVGGIAGPMTGAVASLAGQLTAASMVFGPLGVAITGAVAGVNLVLDVFREREQKAKEAADEATRAMERQRAEAQKHADAVQRLAELELQRDLARASADTLARREEEAVAAAARAWRDYSEARYGAMRERIDSEGRAETEFRAAAGVEAQAAAAEKLAAAEANLKTIRSAIESQERETDTRRRAAAAERERLAQQEAEVLQRFADEREAMAAREQANRDSWTMARNQAEIAAQDQREKEAFAAMARDLAAHNANEQAKADAAIAEDARRHETQRQMAEQAYAAQLAFGAAVQSALTTFALNGLDAVGQGIGRLVMTGKFGAKEFSASMVAGIGQMASAMGSFLISSNLGVLALQALTPAAGIAAGAALVALGGVLSAAAGAMRGGGAGAGAAAGAGAGPAPFTAPRFDPAGGREERTQQVTITVDTTNGNRDGLAEFLAEMLGRAEVRGMRPA